MARPAEGHEWKACIISDEGMKLLYLLDPISQVRPSNIYVRGNLHARPVVQVATSSKHSTSTMATTQMTLVRSCRGQPCTASTAPDNACFVYKAKQLFGIGHNTGQRAAYCATIKHSSSPCCATSSASIWLCRQPKGLRTLHPRASGHCPHVWTDQHNHHIFLDESTIASAQLCVTEIKVAGS